MSPAKIVLKIIYNGFLGAIALVMINLVGSSFNFHIAFNLVTALVAGLLGIPGILLLIMLKVLFGL